MNSFWRPGPFGSAQDKRSGAKEVSPDNAFALIEWHPLLSGPRSLLVKQQLGTAVPLAR